MSPSAQRPATVRSRRRQDPTAPPRGYVRQQLGDTTLVARERDAAALATALEAGTLYAWAAAQPERREFTGRRAAYAVSLPGSGTPVVVRHSQHGGLLAAITGDVFRAPTRAPRELRSALLLAGCGVPTLPVVAYVLYAAAAPGLQRADVATQEIAGASDGSDALRRAASGPERASVLAAIATLLRQLAEAGAVHPDLNLKNVLLAPATQAPGRAPVAWVLDVDRMIFTAPGERALEANLARLTRSLRKWRERRGLLVTEAEIATLAAAARDASA